MHIDFITRSEHRVDELDHKESLEIKINGKGVFSVSNGELEYSTLSRSFYDFIIDTLLEQAWKAGRDGEELTIEYTVSDEI